MATYSSVPRAHHLTGNAADVCLDETRSCKHTEFYPSCNRRAKHRCLGCGLARQDPRGSMGASPSSLTSMVMARGARGRFARVCAGRGLAGPRREPASRVVRHDFPWLATSGQPIGSASRCKCVLAATDLRSRPVASFTDTPCATLYTGRAGRWRWDVMPPLQGWQPVPKVGKCAESGHSGGWVWSKSVRPPKI